MAVVSAILTSVEKITYTTTKGYKQTLYNILISIFLFFLIFLFREHYILTLLAGLVIIYCGFCKLGIFNNHSGYFFNPFLIYILMIIILSAKSDFSLGLTLAVAVLYGILYFVFTFLLKIIQINKTNAYFKELSGLTLVLNGLFLFITGFIIAIDRVEFLEKIAVQIF
jgi:hypothetical protein